MQAQTIQFCHRVSTTFFFSDFSFRKSNSFPSDPCLSVSKSRAVQTRLVSAKASSRTSFRDKQVEGEVLSDCMKYLTSQKEGMANEVRSTFEPH